MAQIELNNYDEVTVSSIEDTYPKLYARIIELGVQYKTEQGTVLVISKNTSVDDCFCWSQTEEGQDFWNSVNLADFNAAIPMQPHLFNIGNKTFINCFGVEIVEKTQIRADDDVSVDFTKKKRLSDY
jgi:hypothetical protein